MQLTNVNLIIYLFGFIMIALSYLIWKDSRGMVPGSISWINSTVLFLFSLAAQIFQNSITLLSASCFLGFISWWLLLQGFYDYYSVPFPFRWRHIFGFSFLYTLFDFILMSQNISNRFFVVNFYYIIVLVFLSIKVLQTNKCIPKRKLLLIIFIPSTCALNGVIRFFQAASGINQHFWFAGGSGEVTYRIVMLIQLLVIQLFELRLVNKYFLKTIVEINSNFFQAQQNILRTLISYSDNNSHDIVSHVSRVGILSEKLATCLGWSEEKAKLLNEAAQYHDIGKIAISDTILNKKEKLDNLEFDKIKTHSIHGEKILSHYQVPVYKMAAKIALQHHENWDGSGYPSGLAQLDIAEESRIVAICDAIDALSRTRCYKSAWNNQEIYQYLINERGKRFDPQITDITIKEKIWEE